MEITLTLYLLKLQDHKYYVGQSDDPALRFAEHLRGTGSKWTRLHKPLEILKTKPITVQSPGEAVLFENWMTLHYMERYGWENVRGGEFLIVESYRLKERLEYIYDTDNEKIRYYIPKCKYIFGKTTDWLIYVLALENEHYYIGCSRRLGKALGEHYSGKGINWTRDYRVEGVLELIVVKGTTDHMELKNQLVKDYIWMYGRPKVLSGQMPGKHIC